MNRNVSYSAVKQLFVKKRFLLGEYGYRIIKQQLFNVLVAWGEFLIGLGLILGCLTTAAIFFALLMNFAFFMAGTVSHNPTDIFFGTLILFAGYNAGRYGLDRWIIPWIRKNLFKNKINAEHVA
jgi:thiosulfate dehydrogenase (quinone) large subunit